MVSQWLQRLFKTLYLQFGKIKLTTPRTFTTNQENKNRMIIFKVKCKLPQLKVLEPLWIEKKIDEVVKLFLK